HRPAARRPSSPSSSGHLGCHYPTVLLGPGPVRAAEQLDPLCQPTQSATTAAVSTRRARRLLRRLRHGVTHRYRQLLIPYLDAYAGVHQAGMALHIGQPLLDDAVDLAGDDGGDLSGLAIHLE